MNRAIVTFLWSGPRGYSPSHVNTLAALCNRYAPSVRFVCVSDFGRSEFAKDVEVVSAPKEALAFARIPSPEGRDWPACYRRLALLSSWGESLGEQLLLLDIDCVPCGPLEKYFDREEDFVAWKPRAVWGRHPRIGGGTWLHRTGTLTHLWAKFAKDPRGTVKRARRAGYRGSDQAVLSYLLGANVPSWAEPNGIYQSQDHSRRDWAVPGDARLIHFNGAKKPWDLLHLPWVRRLYEGAINERA